MPRKAPIPIHIKITDKISAIYYHHNNHTIQRAYTTNDEISKLHATKDFWKDYKKMMENEQLEKEY